jgi:hypothetical protein
MQHGVDSLKIRKFLPLFPTDRRPMAVLVRYMGTFNRIRCEARSVGSREKTA